MESLTTNPILKFNTNQLTNVRKQYNLDKPGDMSRAIDVLEDWIKMQKHFMKKELPRNFLETAIIASKGSLERAKQRLDKICTLRTILPEFFGENLTKNRFENIDIVFKNTVLPKPTDQNYRLYILKCTGSTFSTEQLLNLYRYGILICEYTLANDYNDGIISIIDCTEAALFEAIKVINLTDVRHTLTIMMEGFAMRVKGIHFITTSNAAETLIAMVKPFLSPKVAKRIYVHKDIDSVYQYVPKELLPIEYGGNEKPLTKLYEEQRNELTGKEFLSYVEEMNKAKTDESMRQTDTFNETYLGMPGSFRNLHVD